jgi:hypothetical protein
VSSSGGVEPSPLRLRRVLTGKRSLSVGLEKSLLATTRQELSFNGVFEDGDLDERRFLFQWHAKDPEKWMNSNEFKGVSAKMSTTKPVGAGAIEVPVR